MARPERRAAADSTAAFSGAPSALLSERPSSAPEMLGDEPEQHARRAVSSPRRPAHTTKPVGIGAQTAGQTAKAVGLSRQTTGQTAKPSSVATQTTAHTSK